MKSILPYDSLLQLKPVEKIMLCKPGITTIFYPDDHIVYEDSQQLYLYIEIQGVRHSILQKQPGVDLQIIFK